VPGPGTNTYARSFRSPSPFTSPPTIGVYGVPEVSRPTDVISSAVENG
jgi:hypothetical protein